ncbi:hypothetical protein BMS3Abin15_00899 [bacterium BMS3Abin15]|nr:hypothetical protein BMS3Abin15_00899 [bacterium BMS3Abin15]HDH07590.1 hypothetical protein [Candidatus Moranbacteria bacterium]HDZ85454.1 hypothetical protein [Candidatus Moranbacteria bacterium]
MKKSLLFSKKFLAATFLLSVFLLFFVGAPATKATTTECIAANGLCGVGGDCSRFSDRGSSPTITCDLGVKCCVLVTDPGTGATAPIDFPNPLKFSTVEGVLASLLNALQGIIVVVSVIFIIVGAIFYITSAGNEKRMEMAKKAITASVIGLAIGIAAPSFLHEVSDIIGWDDASKMEACQSITDPIAQQQCIDVLTTSPTLAVIALSTLQFLLSIVGILALIMLVVGGIMYLTSAGDEERITKGKNIFKWSVIGIIIAMAALVIVSQVATFFVSG